MNETINDWERLSDPLADLTFESLTESMADEISCMAGAASLPAADCFVNEVSILASRGGNAARKTP